MKFKFFRLFFLLGVASFCLPQASARDDEPAGQAQPTPAEEDLSAAMDLAREVYSDEFERAKTAAQKAELAEKLLNEGLQTKGDPAGKFTLLSLASKIYAGAGDYGAASEANRALADHFEIDLLARNAAALTTAARVAARPADHAAMIGHAETLLDEILDRDRFDLALTVANLAVGSARKARDNRKLAMLRERIDSIVRWKRQFADVAEASERLQQDALDPEANLVVGKYLCLVKDDWKAGLPLLTLSSDDELKALAARDLSETSNTDQYLIRADSWWKFADQESRSDYQRALRGRAAHWYKRALPELTGLSKARVEKRLEQIGVELAEALDLKSDAVVMQSFSRRKISRRGNDFFIMDESPLMTHGRLHGAVWAEDGVAGGSINLDGKSHSVEFPTLIPLLRGAKALTVSCWIYPRHSGSENAFIFDAGFHANASVSLTYLNEEVGFWMPHDHGGAYLTAKEIATKRWHHVVGVWNGSEQMLYVDGRQVASEPTPELTELTERNLGDQAARLGICAKRGDRRMNRWYFDGRIDEFAVLRRALSESEIAALYYKGKSASGLGE